MRFELINAEKANFPVTVLCRVLEVSCSGFYRWLNAQPSERQTKDERLKIEIKAIHSESRGTYGSPRVHAELQARGFEIGLNRVARLMAELSITGQRPRRFRKTTDSHHDRPIAPDLVERDFNPTEPNRLWAADITYIRTWEGWLYLASVMDCYSRRIVGWAIADHLRAELVIDALEMAVARRRPDRGLVHHSDMGSQLGLNRSSQQLSLR